MTRATALLLILALIISTTSCQAQRKDVNRADQYLYGVSSAETADVVSGIGPLTEASIAVINVPKNAFNFNSAWTVKDSEFEKYVVLFNSSAKLSVYVNQKTVEKVTYTFEVTSTDAIYKAAQDMITTYGQPDSIGLNSENVTNSVVLDAIKAGNDPDLRYVYDWTIERDTVKTYIYLAYYYSKGIHFAYLVVCTPSAAVAGGIPSI